MLDFLSIFTLIELKINGKRKIDQTTALVLSIGKIACIFHISLTYSLFSYQVSISKMHLVYIRHAGLYIHPLPRSKILAIKTLAVGRKTSFTNKKSKVFQKSKTIQFVFDTWNSNCSGVTALNCGLEHSGFQYHLIIPFGKCFCGFGAHQLLQQTINGR